MGKKLKLSDLKDRREDVEQDVLRIRTVMESYKIELEKLNSPANKRMFSAEGLRDKETQLRTKSHENLALWQSQLVKDIGDSFDYRGEWTREAKLRSARFSPASEGRPFTEDAKTHQVLNGILEHLARQNAALFAERLNDEDLVVECEVSALAGDIATVAIYRQEGRFRELDAMKRMNLDKAIGKLEMPDVVEAETLYSELEALVDESDALLEIWQNPTNEMAASRESFHRFNRRKKSEALVKETEEEGQRRAASTLQQSSAA